MAPDGNRTKSLGYQILRKKRKLRTEFSGLSGKQIATLRMEKGNDYVTESSLEVVLSYSGDTPVFDGPHWRSGILIHEATFIDNQGEAAAASQNRGGRHSVLEAVIHRAASAPLDALILTHFSVRYKVDAIDEKIRHLCIDANVPYPVYRIPPGETVRDILSLPPVFVPHT